jgi:hypothetical protein
MSHGDERIEARYAVFPERRPPEPQAPWDDHFVVVWSIECEDGKWRPISPRHCRRCKRSGIDGPCRAAAKLAAEVAALPPVPIAGDDAPAPAVGVMPVVEPPPKPKLSQRDLGRLHAVGKAADMDHDAIKSFAAETYPGVASLHDLNPEQYRYMVDWLQNLVKAAAPPEPVKASPKASFLRLPKSTKPKPTVPEVVRAEVLDDGALQITHPPERAGEIMKDGQQVQPPIGRVMTTQEIREYMIEAAKRRAPIVPHPGPHAGREQPEEPVAKARAAPMAGFKPGVTPPGERPSYLAKRR